MQKSVKRALVAIVTLAAIVVLSGAAFYWFVFRSDNPAEVGLRDRTLEQTAAVGPARSSADGTWSVQPDAQVFVGYRMSELFAGAAIKKEAVGRTPAVSGTMTISGQQVTDVDISADVTQLKSDQSRRDDFISDQGLETAKFTTATFKSAAPVELPSTPALGQKLSVNVPGDLTIHGVTKRVTVPLDAVWNGNTIDVSGKLDITIADFGIQQISIATVTVDTAGKLELALSFGPADGTGTGTANAAHAEPSTTSAPAPAARAAQPSQPAAKPSTSTAAAHPTTTKAPASGGYGTGNGY